MSCVWRGWVAMHVSVAMVSLTTWCECSEMPLVFHLRTHGLIAPSPSSTLDMQVICRPPPLLPQPHFSPSATIPPSPSLPHTLLPLPPSLHLSLFLSPLHASGTTLPQVGCERTCCRPRPRGHHTPCTTTSQRWTPFPITRCVDCTVHSLLSLLSLLSLSVRRPWCCSPPPRHPSPRPLVSHSTPLPMFTSFIMMW